MSEPQPVSKRTPTLITEGDRVVIDWYHEPARSRTVLVQGKLTEWKAPGIVFGVVKKKGWWGRRIPHCLKIFSRKKPITAASDPLDFLGTVSRDEYGNNRTTGSVDVFGRVCMGDHDSKILAKLRSGELDPIEVFWNSSFVSLPKVYDFTSVVTAGSATEMRAFRGHYTYWPAL